jgi:hypothetical protein
MPRCVNTSRLWPTILVGPAQNRGPDETDTQNTGKGKCREKTMDPKEAFPCTCISMPDYTPRRDDDTFAYPCLSPDRNMEWNGQIAHVIKQNNIQAWVEGKI